MKEYILFSCLISGSCVGFGLAVDRNGECGLWLAPSTLPGAGRGIISGKHVHKGEQVENTITLNIGHNYTLLTQLNNYVFGTDDEHDDYAAIIFGGGVLYNHMEPKTVQHHWHCSEEDLVNPAVNPLPYTNSNPASFYAQMDIVPGQEIFSTYGTDGWFTARGMKEQTIFKDRVMESKGEAVPTPATLISSDDLKKYGHCLTDVEIKTSTIPLAGKGLFARKAFSKGDNVVIAPVLTLPRKIVEATAKENVVLKNYCITVPNNESDVLLFPLNNAVLINHQPGNKANLKLRWFDWASLRRKGSYFDKLNGGNNAVSLKEKQKLTPTELFASQFAPFDVRYIALRDIQPDEELFIDYGPAWQASWEKYLEKLYDWQNTQDGWSSPDGHGTDGHGHGHGMESAGVQPPPPLQEGFNTYHSTVEGGQRLANKMFEVIDKHVKQHAITTEEATTSATVTPPADHHNNNNNNYNNVHNGDPYFIPYIVAQKGIPKFRAYMEVPRDMFPYHWLRWGEPETDVNDEL